jgi:hypothetical protein
MSTPIDDTEWGAWVVPAEEFDRIAAELERPARVIEPLVDLARRQEGPIVWMDPEPPTFCQQQGRHVWSPLKPTCVLCGERP